MHRKPSILRKLLRALAVRLLAQTEKAPHAANFSQMLMRIILDLVGFGWLTYAGFTINSTAGSVVAGISCFVLARNFSASEKPDPLVRQ